MRRLFPTFSANPPARAIRGHAHATGDPLRSEVRPAFFPNGEPPGISAGAWGSHASQSYHERLLEVHIVVEV